MTTVTVVRHDTTPTCHCGAALRLRTSLNEGRCCCCRDHTPDAACQLCTTVLWDIDGPGELCLKCASVQPPTRGEPA